MKKFLMIAAVLVFFAAPARADSTAPIAPAAIAHIDDHSGFGTSLFTNISPAGFEDPASSTAVATSVNPADLANMAPASGEETDTAVSPAVNNELDAGSVIAPAAMGVAQ